MRHNKKGTHLGRTTSHNKALMRNLAAQVMEHKQIRTTEAKAKELRRVVDRLITYGKKGSLHHRRIAFRFLRDKDAVTRLFEEIAPTFVERNGGYSRIVKLGYRKGDSAPLSLFQLVGFEVGSEKKKKGDKKETTEKKTTAKESKKKEVAPVEEPAVKAEETEVAPESKEDDKKE